MPYLKKGKLPSNIKQTYKCGCGSHLYQVLCDWHIYQQHHLSVSTTNMTANRTHESKLAVFYNLNNFLTYSIALRLFDSICANMILWLKRLNFGEIPWLYYCQTCVHEKVEVPTSSMLHLMIFHLSNYTVYARCRAICPYLSGQIIHTQTWAICPNRSRAICMYLSSQIGYTQTWAICLYPDE